MKLWNLFKKPSAPMTPLELALVDSLRSNPNHWRITLVDGVLQSHNRELGVILSTIPKSGRVYCRKLAFGEDFCRIWYLTADKIFSERLAAESAAEAAQTEATLKKALKVP